MIQEVTKGEKIQAETINQLIVAANGPQRPQGWFVNTPNGSLHNPQSSMGYQPSPPVPEMNFQAKYVAQWEMTSRSGEYDELNTKNPQKMGWDVLVGPDYATILGYYSVDGIVVLGSENTMDAKLEDIIDRRDPQGFVRTGIYEKPSIKLAIWRSKSEQGDSKTDVLAIQPSDLSEASDRIKTLYPADQDYKMLVDTLLASHDDRNITYQYNREIFLYKKDGDADMLSSTQKSIETGSLSGETFFQLYNFPTETDIKKYDDIDDKLSAYDILLRNTNISSDTSAYTLCYANLSAITMTDSELENAASSIQHNTRYGKGELELYKFHDDTYKKDNVLSSDQILLRTVEEGEAFAKLQYAPLSSVLSALEDAISGMTAISGDTNLESLHQKSIETKKDSSGTYHQLYGFDSPTIVSESSLSSGGYQVVLRDSSGSDKQIVYSEISSLVGSYSDISGDVNVSPSTGKSIETLSGDSGKFHRLYNWTSTGADQSHVISAAFGETRYFPFQDGTGTASDLGEAAHILTRPRAGEKELHYDAYGIRIPKVSPTDITEELHELILSGGGTDISAVRQIVLNTLDDPEAKQPLSSNLNDCFWVQGGNRSNCYGSGIGNSSKTEVVSLDNMKLKADGSNQITLDWGGGNATDSTGKQSLTWEGRGLLDSNENWTVLWDICQLWDKNNNPTVDWENGQLKVPALGNNSIDWKSGVLYDPNNGNVSLNWDVGYAQDPSGSGTTVNWNTGQLWADDNNRTLNWKSRQLIGNWSTNGNLTVGGNGSTLTIGSTTLTEAQLQQLLRLI